MEQIFERLGAVLSSQDETRERLRNVRDIADTKVRVAQRALASLHLTKDGLIPGATAILPLLTDIGEAISDVEKMLPEDAGAFYQYNDIWRNTLQQSTFVCVVVEFLINNDLASHAKVLERFGGNVRLPLEDYLWGVCHAVSELPRLAMNRVTYGDYRTPQQCALFTANVFEAFKQLNFRNDFLRKKYDGMKYDVKRIEEIMYDLSIRGLLKDKAIEPESGADTS